MSLSQKIGAALDSRPDSGALPCDTSVADGAHRLTLHLTAAGPVGLAFSALDFTTQARAEWTPEALKAWGDRLAARVTYLMEPLVVLEHDVQGGEVELRSELPTPRAQQRSYYEVRLNRAGTLRLARVAFDDATRQRRAADCQMTREVLERLTDDIVASVA
ncbi:MAG: hypothetical protein P4L84_32070 [Isosphaeraceae bacterium]|nr:hypothetical protein [Isosphaeraceae bacterium]